MSSPRLTPIPLLEPSCTTLTALTVHRQEGASDDEPNALVEGALLDPAPPPTPFFKMSKGVDLKQPTFNWMRFGQEMRAEPGAATYPQFSSIRLAQSLLDTFTNPKSSLDAIAHSSVPPFVLSPLVFTSLIRPLWKYRMLLTN